MYRISNHAFMDDPELRSFASSCLTQTIKSHLEEYFEPNYKALPPDRYHWAVDIEKTALLITDSMRLECRTQNMDEEMFVAKKFEQFMNLLESPEEQTPDIFIEYLLWHMIKVKSDAGEDFIPQEVIAAKKELRAKLRSYGKEKQDLQDNELRRFIRSKTQMLTEFNRLPGNNGCDFDESLTFWDDHFLLFDFWGLEKTILELSCGSLENSGYGLEYVKAIFTEVDEYPIKCLMDEIGMARYRKNAAVMKNKIRAPQELNE